MRKEGQIEIGYSYHIHKTQGQLVYRNSLSLLVILSSLVCLRRHVHLNPFLFQDSSLSLLIICSRPPHCQQHLFVFMTNCIFASIF